MAMTAMKARMKAANVVAPPKAMKAKNAKKDDQWTNNKNAELQQSKRDNVRLSMEFASIQAAALERADDKEAELQRVQRDNERLAAALRRAISSNVVRPARILKRFMQAALVGDKTRFSSLVMSTDGGTGTPRGAHTLSFDRNGRAIPAAHRPKKIFDALFVKRDGDAAEQLARSESALDDLLNDARSLRRELSKQDQDSLDEYLDSVRETERRIEKAKRWVNIPLPEVDSDHLNLELTPDDPREYLQVMFELIHLAFQTDSTRVATYQIGRENGIGISDHLAKAVGLPLSHQLSHDVKNPGGWKNFGVYCRFLAEEFGRFAAKLKATPEVGGAGNMLDNTLLVFGSASSAFHLSRNYPLILAGGESMGFKHGQFLDYIGGNAYGGSWDGGQEPWQREFTHEDKPLSNLYVTLLRRLGVEVDVFAGSDGVIDAV